MCPALNEVLETLGVEPIHHPESSTRLRAKYLNTGEAYAPTLVFVEDREAGEEKPAVEPIPWGEWLER